MQVQYIVFKNNFLGSVQGMRVDLLWDKYSWNLCISFTFASENTNHFTKDSENEKTPKESSTLCKTKIK